jgi:hypothetical protein
MTECTRVAPQVRASLGPCYHCVAAPFVALWDGEGRTIGGRGSMSGLAVPVPEHVIIACSRSMSLADAVARDGRSGVRLRGGWPLLAGTGGRGMGWRAPLCWSVL